ncbi:MAG: ATP-binding cassette domain-containing protein, partial [Lachnospiraceae bacterium]|nr:ATP-binding cassette domain-containing protein [Lachnospiraceae bacterium]
MAIEVKIEKEYDDFHLDVGFSCYSKRIGILGASGCGKSLTLKSIAGLVDPDEGKIIYDGKVLYDRSLGTVVKPGKRNVGYLFQNYALFPNMTVRENVGAALHGAGKKADGCEEILKKFKLWDVRDHKPFELSGGQQQRTALARMLVTDPEIILLDEPFSAMDTFLREGMRLELMRILNMYDKTVILVSHDRDEIYQMCDYLVLMDKGKVIAQGDTDELFEHPGSVACARLTGCKNISRIERLTDHRVRALDWAGIELITDGKVTDDVTHVGIRAHDLAADTEGVNLIPCGRASVSRLPFEWYVTLENGLWWKLDRDLYDDLDESLIPHDVSVKPERILLLKA